VARHLDDDAFAGAEKFRMALAPPARLRRADTLATTAHRDWSVRRALASAEPFRWSRAYHAEPETTRRVLPRAASPSLPPSCPLAPAPRRSAVLSMLEPCVLAPRAAHPTAPAAALR
jgi:hypothetical protein